MPVVFFGPGASFSPAWLSVDAPDGDVILSSRVRLSRNLSGFRFPGRASSQELVQILRLVVDVAQKTPLAFESYKSLTNSERDYLVRARLISPEFEWTLPGRGLLIDPTRSLSVMINEEDHLRIQSLTAGLSISAGEATTNAAAAAFGMQLPFAFSIDYGYLSASFINLGAGKRLSAMFHLIGLAQGRRLQSVIAALSGRNIVVRGLFGESSRAVGAFAQISTLGQNDAEFVGACEYLLREERLAREALGRIKLADKANQAREFALGSRTLSLADSLRILAWLRWAAVAELEGFHLRPRAVDIALTTLEMKQASDEKVAARKRADYVRKLLDPS